jgi:hypothetical protein
VVHDAAPPTDGRKVDRHRIGVGVRQCF